MNATGRNTVGNGGAVEKTRASGRAISRLAKSFALLLSFAGLLLGATNANAAACTAIASTAWNVQTTWGAAGTGCVGATGGIPGAADTVTVPTTFTVTVTAAAAAASLTVNGTGSVVNNSTLTISGALGGTGGLTNGTAASVLDIGGNSTITTLTATFAGNTVNYTGAAQTAKVTTYSNLTLSGSLAKTFATNPTVNGVLSMEGAATVTVTTGVVTYGAAATLQYNKPAAYTTTLEEWPATFAATGGVIIKNTGVITLNANKVLSNGVPLTIDLGATLANATRALNVGGNLTVNGTLTGSSGAITLSGTARTIDGTGSIIATSTGTLLITTSRTILNTANLTIASPTTLSAATTVTNNGIINKTTTAALNGANATTSIWVNAAGSTLNYAGTNAPMATGVLTASAANTVNYNGAAQTVEVPSGAPATYYHLTFSGSGVKTMPATAMTVTGDFTMSGAAGTSATAAAALTVGGNFSIGTGNTFANGTNALNVAGNFDQSGTFTAGAGVVTLNGGAAVQTISGVGALGFANLTINNTGGITLARNVTVISAIIGAHTLTSTCPTDWTLISNGGATVEHSCAASVVSINCSVSCAATSAATVSWTVIFNNSVTGVTSGNFTLVNVGLGGTPAITLVSGGGTTWTVTASTGTGTGTLELDMANATGVTPTVTNLPFTGQVYSIVGAGVINTYYPGTASVSAGATSITLGAATGAATPIAIGDMLLIIQMQDATIDSTNTATYGTVSGTPTAGKYEYVLAASAVGVGGGTLTLSCGTLNAYTDANYVAGSSGQKRFQVIRVPVYASYTINAITASAWNGSTGGVLAFDVTGALNLNTATVDVSGTGFRGGASRMLVGPGATGANTDYRTLATVNNNASKGEGIAGTPFYVFTAPSTLTNTAVEGYPNGSHARGAPANAGGGGTDLDPPINDMNPGGGGGANGGAGGGGGLAWCPTFNAGAPPLYGCGPYSGGLGGIPVAGLGATRLTLGGGGGGGTTNNGTGTLGNGLNSSGAAGGGIIMLRTGSMTGAATFNANGSDGDSTIRNDGSGGGGAGGVVLISTGSGMGGATINVNGGNGGSNLVPPGTTSPPHGPGGGGGGGYAITTGAPAASSAAAGANGVTYNVGVLFGAYGATAGSAGSLNPGLAASAIPGVALGATGCASVDHFAINIGGASASTCIPKNITITAQNAANATVTNYTGTVNITTSPAHGDWATGTPLPGGTLTPGAADSGAASYQFVLADSGVITLALTDQHADASLTVTVADSVVPATSSTSAAISFSGNAFVITNDTVQVAGRPQAMSVQMSCSGSTATYYTGTKNLKAWYTRDLDDPGGTAPSITGMTSPPLGTTVPGANNLTTLTFNASGLANFNLTTVDVGKYAINLRDDSLSFVNAVINGSSNTITTRPFALVVSAIKQGAVNNPANNSSGVPVFAKAGTSFQATVGAYLWNGAADTEGGIGNGVPDAGATLAQITANGAAPSYRWLTTLSAGVPFTPATPLDAPPGTGTAGGFSNGAQTGACPTGTPNCFTSGIATPTNLSYSEVGSFTLSGAATNFLNTAGVDLTAANGTALVFDNTPARNGVVGRFYPDHFDVSLNVPVFGTACTGFSYAGQNFSYTTAPVITATARNFGGTTTINYAGPNDGSSWWKITSASLTGKTYSQFPASPVLAAAPTAPDPAIVTNGNGTGTLTFNSGTGFSFARGSPISPFDADIALGINVIDADGVAYAANPASFGTATAGNGIAFSSGKTFRYGKLALSNASGSERQNLPVTISAMYYAGSPTGWSINTGDGCTATLALPAYASNTATDACYGTCTGTATASVGSVLLRRPTGNTYAALAMAAAPTPTTAVTLVSGRGTVTLSAPLVSGTPTPGVLEFIFVAPSWLKTNAGMGGTAGNYDWNPLGRVTFGVPATNVSGPATNKSKYIYIRENY